MHASVQTYDLFTHSVNSTKEAMPSHFIVKEDTLIHIPDWMTFSDASTLPSVAMTVYICLVQMAKLKKSDTILIHTASGGVGLVAIELAQRIGAEIVATAGSKRKRYYLRNQLGIKYVYDSRSTNYGELARKE